MVSILLSIVTVDIQCSLTLHVPGGLPVRPACGCKRRESPFPTPALLRIGTQMSISRHEDASRCRRAGPWPAWAIALGCWAHASCCEPFGDRCSHERILRFDAQSPRWEA